MRHPSDAIRGMKSKKLEGKTIVMGITGSIAAVETVKLARELIRHGAKIVPVMSGNACGIIHPNAIEFATGEKAIVELSGKAEHVLYCGAGGEADLLLIAPCTANTISKIALGIDDTPVTTFATTAIGSKIPIVIVPAMHSSMYENKFVMENVEKCRKNGITFVEPRMEEGKAKIAESEDIVETVIRELGRKDFGGKKVLIIGGGTSEFIDDVRVITNLSSGKMALALAKVAYERGGDVEIWHSPNVIPPAYAKARKFVISEDIINFIGSESTEFDYVMNCAAISDFIPEKKEGKIPSGKPINLHLLPAERINPMLKKIGKIVVGFKLESNEGHLKDKATDRMRKDGIDFIVANTIATIGSDNMKSWIIDEKENVSDAEGSKEEVAEKILDFVS